MRLDGGWRVSCNVNLDLDLETFERGKEAAAIKSVDNHVKSGDIVGIGSGSTIVYAVKRLAELVNGGKLTGIQCVPTSFQVTIFLSLIF